MYICRAVIYLYRYVELRKVTCKNLIIIENRESKFKIVMEEKVK
jgi:hypothetical protein